jgi:uncharacterized membrane protein
MALRRQDAIAACETRTQGARIAALFVRPRTQYRAGQRVLAAVVSLFSSLLARLLRLLCAPLRARLTTGPVVYH